MDELRADLKVALAGIHPGWRDLLKDAKVVSALKAAFEDARAHGVATSPPPPLVLEALRYFGPDEARVIVLGQDPYPTGAQGLSFSCAPGTPVKASLRNVLANLVGHGLARPRPVDTADESRGAVACGDLRSWALQGVLLLNTALTTHEGKIRKQIPIWTPFTRALLKGLTRAAAAAGRPLVCLLWGGEAKKFRTALDPATRVLEWRHPSPMADNQVANEQKFAAHTHFADTNGILIAASLRPISWDPLAYTVAFTDGAASANGKANARASFAAHVMTGPLRGTNVAGVVAPRRYAFVDAANPRLGFVATASPPPDVAASAAKDGKKGKKAPAPQAAKPTNNRGELLGICWALLLLLRSDLQGRCEIVTDSDYSRLTIEKHLPNRRKDGTAASLKNFDLLQIAEVLLARLRERLSPQYADTGVTITHTYSHRNEPPRKPVRAWSLWKGNDTADRLAGDAKDSGEPARDDGGPALVEVDPVLRWRLFDRHAPKK